MRPFSDCVAESNPGCLRGVRMMKKLSRFVVAILAFVLAVLPVGCGLNTTGGKGPDE